MEMQFMGSSKEAAPKYPIMNYEQLLSSVFPSFHGLKNNLKFCWTYCSVRTKKMLNIKVKFKKKKNLGHEIMKKWICNRLPAEFKSAGKSRTTPRRHLFFLICDCDLLCYSVFSSLQLFNTYLLETHGIEIWSLNKRFLDELSTLLALWTT